uniref:Uncharacterized protein n=1 Tax=Lepeophtheirus salmonis TaxID=72036 RepID=A0A0K2U6T7_LEPSM
MLKYLSYISLFHNPIRTSFKIKQHSYYDGGSKNKDILLDRHPCQGGGNCLDRWLLEEARLQGEAAEKGWP